MIEGISERIREMSRGGRWRKEKEGTNIASGWDLIPQHGLVGLTYRGLGLMGAGLDILFRTVTAPLVLEAKLLMRLEEKLWQR